MSRGDRRGQRARYEARQRGEDVPAPPHAVAIARGTVDWRCRQSRVHLKREARHAPCASLPELKGLWYGQGGKCGLTGVPIDPDSAHLDHVVPHSKGGPHTIDNLRWLHPMANRAKGDKSDVEFGEWLDAVIFQRMFV